MHTISAEEILRAAAQFEVGGVIIGCTPYGGGHINGTSMIIVEQPGGALSRYILQIINGNVFPKPEHVVENIVKVTRFLRGKGLTGRRTLHVVRARDGSARYWNASGLCFRMYYYVPDSVCLDQPESPKDFYESGFAFGEFQRNLTDFPVEELHETLADFHNTPKRFNDLMEAISLNRCGRVSTVQKEIRFIQERMNFCSVLIDAHKAGKLPLRVTHNDTKLNNVMLDKTTRKALCVIDLDTVMPGFSVNDFGDAIRFGANTAAEDEKDLSKVSLDMELFEAFADGFLTGCDGMLHDNEIRLMPEGAKMMTLECGIRFLTDYLSGDTYFKTTYPGQNLDRCRTQLKLVECMEEHWWDMKACVEKFTKK